MKVPLFHLLAYSRAYFILSFVVDFSFLDSLLISNVSISFFTPLLPFLIIYFFLSIFLPSYPFVCVFVSFLWHMMGCGKSALWVRNMYALRVSDSKILHRLWWVICTRETDKLFPLHEKWRETPHLFRKLYQTHRCFRQQLQNTKNTNSYLMAVLYKLRVATRYWVMESNSLGGAL